MERVTVFETTAGQPSSDAPAAPAPPPEVAAPMRDDFETAATATVDRPDRP